ncbi:MAG: type II secretion system protein M, partial [Solirubrobacterales bacterium]|nr:type II secretion system protein M [Solirubrobacterales bacterium]
MSGRDRILIALVGGVVVMAGIWFGALAPKRQEAAALADRIAQAETRRDAAVSSAATAEQARASSARDSATLARLGKAVPIDDDVASLVFQLESLARRHGVDFRAVQLTGTAAAPAPAPAPASATPAAKSS